MRRGQIVAWILMMSLSVLIAVGATRYFANNPDYYFPEQREIFSNHLFSLLAHVSGSAFALFVGPLQFLPKLRRTRPRIHRTIGTSYIVAVVVGGVAGGLMAPRTYGGDVAHLGFGLLAICWLGVTLTALWMILAKRVAAHGRWMVRSFALTFAAVTLRLWLPALDKLGLPLEIAYPIVAWLAWVPNVICAEIYLHWRGAGTSHA
jgi:hypothetical protein